MKWEEIELKGRSKYSLSQEWHLCGVDASDIEVIEVEFRRKGPRGGWLKNKKDIFRGYVVNEMEKK